MKKLLLKSMLLLSALIVGSSSVWAQASVGTVLWSEDFSGYSADAVPSGDITNSHTGTAVYGGVTLSYACTVSGTKVYSSGGPTGGSGNNLLIKSKNGSFSVSGISTGGAAELTVTFAKGGSGSLSVTSSTTGVTISGSTSGSTITTNGASTLQLTFKNTNTGTSNLRIDNIQVAVKTAGSSVKAPTFSPVAGTVEYGTIVSLSQVDSKPIYYTTDGSTTPTKSSTLFNPLSPIEIVNDMTIKAIAYDDDDASAVVTATYSVQRPDYPTFSVEAGAVESGTEVTVTAAEGCTLYYTTDGTTDPTGVGGISAESRTKSFTLSSAQTIKAASKDSHGFFSIVRTNAYTIDVFNDPTFSVEDVTIEAGYSAIPAVTTNSAGTITYVSDDDAIATFSDGKIVGVSAGTVTITANIAKDGTNKYRAASTTFEVTVTKTASWDSSSKGIDELTYSKLVSGSNGSYQTFSNKSFNSSAKYAGNAYKATTIDFIQVRGSDNSGIVTTTSGGKARKVIVSWTSSRGSDGNTIDVYGKSTAYSAASDLYGANAGTKLGSIVRGTSTELLIGNDVEYIGIRSKSGTCYLDDITIYWEGDAVSLSDASDYTPVAKDYAKVTLNRSFVEGWNGIILPFKLTNDVKTALGVTKVKTLSSATESAGAITLNFGDVDLPVSAGTPVWVKFAAAKASGDVILNGVKLETTAPTNVAKTVASSTFTLTGTYGSTDLESSEAYFVSGTKFYHKAAGVPLTATPFRSYIVQTGANARVYFDLEDETTGIVEMNAYNTKIANQYFDLQGRKIAQPTKGLYIMNGKKVIIK